MKPLYTTLLCMLWVIAAHAQPQYRLRAIAISDYKYEAFRKQDSTAFLYPGNNWGIAEFEWLNRVATTAQKPTDIEDLMTWDTARRYFFSADTINTTRHYYHTYVYANKINGLTQFSYDSMGKVIDGEKEHRVYNNNIQLTEWYKNERKYMWHYSGPQHQKPDTAYVYEYDAANPVWAMKGYTEYTYSNTSQVALEETNGWQYGSQVIRTVYENNSYFRPEKITEYGTAAKILSITTRTYNGTDIQTETHQKLNPQGTQLVNDRRKTYYYDANSLVTEIITQLWNNNNLQWENLSQELYTYSMADSPYIMPLTYELKRWDNNTWKYMFDDAPGMPTTKRIKLYYEKRWPASVNETGTATPLVLYPSPAGNLLTISCQLPAPTAFDIAVFDINGRMVMQWNEPATIHYSKTISTELLPAGNYIMKINTAGTGTTKQFSIIK